MCVFDRVYLETILQGTGNEVEVQLALRKRSRLLQVQDDFEYCFGLVSRKSLRIMNMRSGLDLPILLFFLVVGLGFAFRLYPFVFFLHNN